MTPARRALLGGLLGAGLVAGLIVFGFLEFLELRALDTMFRLRGPRPPKSPIVIVAIDEDSFDELNLTWPFPRALHGKLLERLRAERPIAVGLDMFFGGTSPLGAADDEAFAEGIRRAGNVALVLLLRTEVRTEALVKRSLEVSNRTILDAAGGVAGPAESLTDLDGFVRRGAIRAGIDGQMLPGFVHQLHALAARGGIPVRPFPDGEEILINWRGGPETFPRIPYYRVLAGEVRPEAIHGKIVLVGATSPAMHDVFLTPFAGALMAGVEVQANALDNLLNGDYLREVPARAQQLVAILAAVVAGTLVGWLCDRAVWVVASLILATAWGTFLAFVLGGVWVRSVGVMLALAVGLLAAVVLAWRRAPGRV